MSNTQNNPKTTTSQSTLLDKKRRLLVKTTGVAWVTPVLTTATLPAHAQTSEASTGSGAPLPPCIFEFVDGATGTLADGTEYTITGALDFFSNGDVSMNSGTFNITTTAPVMIRVSPTDPGNTPNFNVWALPGAGNNNTSMTTDGLSLIHI